MFIFRCFIWGVILINNRVNGLRNVMLSKELEKSFICSIKWLLKVGIIVIL